MRIAYLCDISPEYHQPYSGGNARIFKALQGEADVDILPQDWAAAEPLRRLLYRLPDGANLRLRWRLHLALGRIAARSAYRALEAKRYDVVFGAYSFQSFAGFRAPYQLLNAFTADATFSTYKRSEVGQNFGSSWASKHLLDPITLRAERKIYRGLDLALWPSDWLKREADALYGLSDAQSLVLPWGANVEDVPPLKLRVLAADGPLWLLVVGRDWFAKGGPLAFEVMQQLRAGGVDARLRVIGAEPPVAHRSEHVEVLGALDKARPEDKARFDAAFQDSHFLVQPSFESWGFAFCEAAAYGLPALCYKIGGVPVKDGQTGHALPAGTKAEAFAAQITAHLAAPEGYAAMCRAARADYEQRLNWDSWAKAAVALFRERLA